MDMVMDTLAHTPAMMWETTRTMAPYLLFGFAVAGILSVLISPDTVERHLGRRGFRAVLKAALFGVPLPLCSCGVIPVSASLRRHGASKGAMTAFLVSTPQTGVDSITVTYSLLGPFFAVFRPVAALVTGLVGGLLVDATEPQEDRDAPAAPPPPAAEVSRHWLMRMVLYAFVELPRDLARPLLFGIALAGLIAAVAPDPHVIERTIGTGLVPMLILMAVGIPLYVCATASVPLAAALIHAGFTPGAALVFLITGPATNAATIAITWKLLGRRAAIIYLVTIGTSAIAAGLLLDYVFALRPEWRHPPEHAMLPEWLGTASAVVLAVVLAAALWPRRSKGAQPAASSGVAFGVTGMTCNHCAATVRRVLSECANVTGVTVDLASGRAEVQGASLDVAALRQAVESVGYGVRELPAQSAKSPLPRSA